MRSTRSTSKRIVRRIVRSKSRDSKLLQTSQSFQEDQTPRNVNSSKNLSFTQKLSVIHEGQKSGSSSQSTVDNTPVFDNLKKPSFQSQDESPANMPNRHSFRLIKRTRTVAGNISQMSQQEFPIRGRQALYRYQNELSMYEQAEILEYSMVYYIGKLSSKIKSYNFTDDEGFYITNQNDQIRYRYQVQDLMGRGSFGTALRCLDHKYNNYVAIKVMKRTQTVNKDIEITALSMLNENDPGDRYPVAKMRKNFKFRGHQCIVFELLSINLYSHLKNQPKRMFELSTIRTFARQILEGLKFIHETKIIHCDLKPENILLRHPTTQQLKIIDFGTCCLENQCNYTYVQSRYYRSPEVILGCPFSYPADIWSLGVLLTELYTGYPIFRGEDEYDQLLQIIATIGEPPFILLRNAKRSHHYFQKGSLLVRPNSKGEMILPNSRPFEAILPEDIDPNFLQFIKSCLKWRPMTRITAEEGLNHNFITGEEETPAARRRRERRARRAELAKNNEK